MCKLLQFRVTITPLTSLTIKQLNLEDMKKVVALFAVIIFGMSTSFASGEPKKLYKEINRKIKIDLR